jgi:hypothetical protein
MSVPFPATTTGSNHDSLAGVFQISQKLARQMIANQCADGHSDHTVLAAPAVAVAARAISAAPALDQFLITQIQKSRQLRVGFRDNVASGAAVAAIRRAPAHELLPTKADTAPPTVPGDHMDFGFVDKLHGWHKSALADLQMLWFVFLFYLCSIIPLQRAKKKPRKGLFIATAHFY